MTVGERAAGLLVLQPEAISARTARRWASAELASLGLDDLADVVELLVTEVVTNSVIHAGTVIQVRICHEGSGVRVEVRDGSRVSPRRHVGFSRTATTGRGTQLLDSLASRWGWLPTDDGGKVTWFLLLPGDHEQVDADQLLDRWST